MDYMPNENPIQIKCQTKEYANMGDLKDFQRGLKKLSARNREKLVGSILKKGFIAPIFVWSDEGEKKILDGHQRIKTLEWMEQRGWKIPKLPIVTIDADNEEDAKNKLLAITSQYGELTIEGFADFSSGIEIDFSTLSIDPVIDMMKKQKPKNGDVEFTEYLGEENNYIVLKFENDIDFINAQTLFELKTVKAYSTKKDKDNSDTFRKMGIGRVIDGVKGIEMIRKEK